MRRADTLRNLIEPPIRPVTLRSYAVSAKESLMWPMRFYSMGQVESIRNQSIQTSLDSTIPRLIQIWFIDLCGKWNINRSTYNGAMFQFENEFLFHFWPSRWLSTHFIFLSLATVFDQSIVDSSFSFRLLRFSILINGIHVFYSPGYGFVEGFRSITFTYNSFFFKNQRLSAKAKR